jgi:hypothetical protein
MLVSMETARMCYCLKTLFVSAKMHKSIKAAEIIYFVFSNTIATEKWLWMELAETT